LAPIARLNHAQAHTNDWKLRSYLKFKKFEMLSNFSACEIWTLHKIDTSAKLKLKM
jgi:hypothetical protein